jgi:hypothetical protein
LKRWGVNVIITIFGGFGLFSAEKMAIFLATNVRFDYLFVPEWL